MSNSFPYDSPILLRAKNIPFFSRFFLPVPPVEVLQGFVQHAILGGKLRRRRRRHLKRLVLQDIITCERLDFFTKKKTKDY